MGIPSSGDFQDYQEALKKLLEKRPLASEEELRELIDPFIVGLSRGKCVIKSDQRHTEGEESLSRNGYDDHYSIPKFHCDYSLRYSVIPDLLGVNSFLLEVKKPSEGLNQRKFRVEGAKKLIQLYEAGELTEKEIESISASCGNKFQTYPTYVGSICIDVGPKDKSWDAGNLFTVTFEDGSSIELYQQDWYILDLYFVHNCKSVILINGKCAKRWFIKNNGRLEKDSYDLTDEKDFNRFKEDFKNDLQ